MVSMEDSGVEFWRKIYKDFTVLALRRDDSDPSLVRELMPEVTR
jgi:hypothetical protein